MYLVLYVALWLFWVPDGQFSGGSLKSEISYLTIWTSIFKKGIGFKKPSLDSKISTQNCSNWRFTSGINPVKNKERRICKQIRMHNSESQNLISPTNPRSLQLLSWGRKQLDRDVLSRPLKMKMSWHKNTDCWKSWKGVLLMKVNLQGWQELMSYFEVHSIQVMILPVETWGGFCFCWPRGISFTVKTYAKALGWWSCSDQDKVPRHLKLVLEAQCQRMQQLSEGKNIAGVGSSFYPCHYETVWEF